MNLLTKDKMNTIKNIAIGGAIFMMSIANSLAGNQIESPRDIKSIFDETKELCSKDNGLLWGHSLDVPILFIDEENGVIYSNKNSSKLELTEENNMYVGALPDFIEVKKGPQKIDKRNWAVIPLPLPENKIEQQCLILHEAFHCLQPQIDLKPLPYNNNHMEEMEARLWLKLEWKALEFALQSEGEDRKQAIIDAICFRKYRRALFSDCDGCENRFEIHEGMAEYTANKICRTPNEFKSYLQTKLTALWESKSYVDCFAYYTGPVYAYLLDETEANWRNQLGSKDDISILVQTAYNIALPFDVYMEAEERSVLYSGAKIMGEELDREIAL
ncbi:hypothetical protein [Marinifilum caeruleilacunae]|uniref:Uncharacterized protein n=1 Tax=Marinifilum caeruleilacunae TaxID=2499076 RepID=A0ABX1WWX5_9BACT|nr:hypothetical protein [Marinifilum caeruleilacunae]NOU60625.1 hypothetical protein [Marinifilum caeruleilacunae]